MKYIISLSGGIASAASALCAAERGYEYDLVFADTTIEDADLYRFIRDVAVYLGKDIHWLCDGRDPWDTYVDNKIAPNNRFAPCSRILKTDQVKNWAAENSAPDDVLVLGMYLDEEDRLTRAAKNWAPRAVRSLLIDHKIFPGKAARMIKDAGIATPSLYDLGFPHNNCGGFCPRAGQGQFATLLDRKPQFYAHMEDREADCLTKLEAKGASVAARGGFIRVTRKGQTEYLSMRDFRVAVQSGNLSPKMYEMGGCGCFVDDPLEMFPDWENKPAIAAL